MINIYSNADFGTHADLYPYHFLLLTLATKDIRLELFYHNSTYFLMESTTTKEMLTSFDEFPEVMEYIQLTIQEDLFEQYPHL
jgi:kynurenine formamidase